MKITVIGAGNVGATCANNLAISGKVNEIILLDKTEGHAEGKCMDINQSLSILGGNKTNITGCTNNYEKTSNSDIIVIAAGAKRTAEMSRVDLLKINSKIIKDITLKSLRYSPKAIFIIATNPLDNMVYQALLSSNLPRNRIIGMAGVLDNARYVSLLSQYLNINPNSIKAVVMGSHNNDMLILKRYTSIEGIPLTNLINSSEPIMDGSFTSTPSTNNDKKFTATTFSKGIDEIIEKTKNGGKNIINLSGTSAYYAPGAGIAKIVEAIALDKNTILTASVMLQGEYGIKGCCIGVPIVLGKTGLKKVIKINLNKEESNILLKSVEELKKLNILLKP